MGRLPCFFRPAQRMPQMTLCLADPPGMLEACWRQVRNPSPQAWGASGGRASLPVLLKELLEAQPTGFCSLKWGQGASPSGNTCPPPHRLSHSHTALSPLDCLGNGGLSLHFYAGLRMLLRRGNHAHERTQPFAYAQMHPLHPYQIQKQIAGTQVKLGPGGGILQRKCL